MDRFCINGIQSNTTFFSPYFLVHGREAVLPTEILTRDIKDQDLSEEGYIQDIVK